MTVRPLRRMSHAEETLSIQAVLPDGWTVSPAGNRSSLGERGWHIYGPFRSAPVGSIWQYRVGRFGSNFEATVLTQWGPVRSLHRKQTVAAVWVVSVVTDEMHDRADVPKRCNRCES